MGSEIVYPGRRQVFRCADFASLERHCYACQGPATQLCDEPMQDLNTGKRVTCDATMCKGCSQRIDRKDYCHEHRKKEESSVPSYGRRIDIE